MLLNPDNKEIMQIVHLFDEYLELANFYELQCANDYNKYKPKIEKALNEYIVRYGQRVDFGPFDLKPVLEFFENFKDVYRFFQLTHSLKNNKYVNNLDKILEAKPHNRLTEFFPPRGKTISDNYPLFKQDQIDLALQLDSTILNLIISNSNLAPDFANYILSICSHVQTNYFKNRINIFNEIGGSLEMISNIFIMQTKKQTNIPLYKALCNGCCMNLCGTIEKIIRNVFIEEESDFVYIDESKLTLGQLLNSQIKISSISEGLKYCLKYFLLTDLEVTVKEKRPGKNIRNWLTHNANDKYDKVDYQLCIELFYLTISLVGDLVIVSLVSDK